MLQAGDVFAGYTIEGLLGSGGVGVVYLARHPRLERRVALKVLSDMFAADPDAREAFDRETTLVARLEHPNIVTVHDRSGPEDPVLWLSMRHVTGGDADKLLTRTPEGLPPEQVVKLVSDVAEALDYAHDQGVLHRDVKPANLLLEPYPRHGQQALLSDFGIARRLEDTATRSSLSATFAYTAPERFRGERVDHRADIYSLGCTMFRLVTGRTPYPGTDQAAIMAGHLTEPPPAPTRMRPDLPPEWDGIIATALAKDPADRYPTCGELAAAARHAIGATPLSATYPGIDTETQTSVPSAALPPAPRPRRLTRRRLLIGGALAVPVIAAGAGASLIASRSPGAKQTPSRVLIGHSDDVTAVAFNRDGSLLATASADHTVGLWTVATGLPAGQRLLGHEDDVETVAFDPGGGLMASAGTDRTIRWWHPRTHQPAAGPLDVGFNILAVTFSPDGSLLAIACADHAVRLWNADASRFVGEPMRGHDDDVTSVAFSPDGLLLASGSNDNTVRLWNVRNQQQTGLPLTGHSGKVS
ncbi:MAG: serine/threonine protein kinase, partial [Nocardia sp.]|nr:serine/threonine protein kinase [Nocardia sp.]